MIVLLSLPAWAWQSVCFTGEADGDDWAVCNTDLEQARGRWVLHDLGDDGSVYGSLNVPEHALLLEAALALAGVGTDRQEDHTLSYYSAGRAEDGGSSYVPALESPEHLVERTLRVSEMSQLPDMAFSLSDWVEGNENCPPGDGVDSDTCHQLLGYLGALNSGHFLPQAESFYSWYHQLALTQADQCASMRVEGATESFPETVLACDQLALTLEAIGQHYLQDAWSAGHMWERWGSADLSAWERGDLSADEVLARAIQVGLFSGLIHGSKAFMESSLPNSGTWDDPMCAPAPSGESVLYVDGLSGDRLDAVGDLFYDEMRRGGWLEDQKSALFSCSANSVRSVASTAGMDLSDLDSGVDATRNADDAPACFGQRATNETMSLGATIHQGSWPNQTAVPHGSLLRLLGVAEVKAEGDASVEIFSEEFRDDATAAMFAIVIRGALDPDKVTSASMADTSILGVARNAEYDETDGPPVAWVDPELPWGLDDETERGLSLAFVDATAWSRCQTDVLATVEHLRGGSEMEQALCADLAEPFVREIDGEDTLCDLDGSDKVIEHDGGVSAWCAGDEPVDCTAGSGTAIVLTTSGLTRVDMSAGAVTENPLPNSLAVASDPTGLAICGATVAVVDGSGDLTSYDLDSATEGSTLSLGGTPSAVSLVGGDTIWALVTLADTEELVVVDMDDGSICERVDVGRNETDEVPKDVTVSDDRVFVSLYGTTTLQGDAVAMLDLAALQDCATAGDELVGHIDNSFGTPKQIGALAVSPDQSWLAIGTHRDSTAAVYGDGVEVFDLSTEPPSRVKVNSYGPINGFWAPVEPLALAWTTDATQLVFTNESGMSGGTNDSAGGVFDGLPTVRKGTWTPGTLSSGSESTDIGLDSEGHSVLVDDSWAYIGGADGGITAISLSDFSSSTSTVSAQTTLTGSIVEMAWY